MFNCLQAGQNEPALIQYSQAGVLSQPDRSSGVKIIHKVMGRHLLNRPMVN